MAGLLNEKEQGCCFLISAPGPPLPLRPHRHGLLTDVHFDEWSKAFQGGTAVGLRDPEPATRVLRLQQSGTVRLLPQTLFYHATHLQVVRPRLAISHLQHGIHHRLIHSPVVLHAVTVNQQGFINGLWPINRANVWGGGGLPWGWLAEVWKNCGIYYISLHLPETGFMCNLSPSPLSSLEYAKESTKILKFLMTRLLSFKLGSNYSICNECISTKPPKMLKLCYLSFK